jgi:hypothetical protein
MSAIDGAVLEDGGSDAHVIFAVDAPRVELDEISAAASHEEEAKLITEDRRAHFNARVNPMTNARGDSVSIVGSGPLCTHD